MLVETTTPKRDPSGSVLLIFTSISIKLCPKDSLGVILILSNSVFILIMSLAQQVIYKFLEFIRVTSPLPTFLSLPG